MKMKKNKRIKKPKKQGWKEEKQKNKKTKVKMKKEEKYCKEIARRNLHKNQSWRGRNNNEEK